MLAGTALALAAALGVAPPAGASGLLPAGGASTLRDGAASTAGSASTAGVTGSAGAPAPGAAGAADQPPQEFGTDWHDPVTAAPPVPTPDTKSCSVTLAEARFRDFTPYQGTFTPPSGCGTRWNKVVLYMDGAVKGRQYDRLGYLDVGGVEVLRTSTPEPSPDGIRWSVEKDVTRYASVFRAEQPVEMLIGNVVDSTYTGVIDVKVTLTFYATGAHAPAASGPDRVLTLANAGNQGTSYAGDLTTPRNSERILAEVYATGSGGGCEEFWYQTVPDGEPYSCTAKDGPYREVQIRVDGKLAGVAAPFPHVWTGGWSNPFLWYVIPGPHAFDVQPVTYDLTPFAGRLNDGKAHRVEVSVLGVPEGQSGWSVPTNVLVWQDAGSSHVTGALTGYKESDPPETTDYTPGDGSYRLDAEGGHRLAVSGYVNTSHGRVSTTVDRTLANTSSHTWTAGENNDALTARWSDRESVAVASGGHVRTSRTDRSYTMDGAITIGSDDRLRTVMSMGDRSTAVELRDGRRAAVRTTDDAYDGDATWTLDVPREERHAVGTSRERYRVRGTGGCYDRTLATEQGALTEDRMRC
jgi:Peptide N-acetyl-beta-D-glucosaminyl asparaginase amidase A